jgi:N-methylhydantoinase A
LGILASDVVKDFSRTVVWRISGDLPAAQLNREFRALEKTAAKDFCDESWPGSPHYHRSVEIRYRGQGYELNLPLSKNLLRDFQQEHQRRYGYHHPNREVELVTLRLRARVKSTRGHVATAAPGCPGRAKLGRLPWGRTTVLFEGKKLETNLNSRDELRPGKRYSGPAIITEYSATTFIPPGKGFRLDRAANLIVTIR